MALRAGETLAGISRAAAGAIKGLRTTLASRRERLRAWARQEKGAIMFVVIAVTFALLLFTPVIIDYASLHYTRRIAQNAADAAALSAAIECSDAYTLDTGNYWWDDRAYVFTTWYTIWPVCCTCWTSDMCPVTMYYVSRVLLLGNDWTDCGGFKKHGKEYAEDYSGYNGSELIDYTISPLPIPFYHLPRVKLVEGFPIMPVQFRVEVKRRVPMIYGALYGQQFEVKAWAVAETYLDDYDTGTQACAGACKPWIGTVTTYDFKWKVRLVQ